MMQTLKASLLLAAATGMLAACTQQDGPAKTVQVEQAATDPAKALPVRKTVKPGAAVSFSHSDLETVSIGQNGRVTVEIREGYENGTLLVEASGSDGLDVFGAQATSRFDMAEAGPHLMELSYAADADGLYRINIMASAAPETGIAMSRAYAIRVQVGKGGARVSKPAGERAVDAEGNPVVRMRAEETITVPDGD